jgi:hypothetical protein
MDARIGEIGYDRELAFQAGHEARIGSVGNGKGCRGAGDLVKRFAMFLPGEGGRIDRDGIAQQPHFRRVVRRLADGIGDSGVPERRGKHGHGRALPYIGEE